MGRVCAWEIEYVTGEVDFRRGGLSIYRGWNVKGLKRWRIKNGGEWNVKGTGGDRNVIAGLTGLGMRGGGGGGGGSMPRKSN